MIRGATGAVLSFRIAYGVALVLSPKKAAGGRWLGEGAGEPAAVVPLRGMGAREIALHGMALRALLTGSPIRPWLLASLVGDLADIAATTGSRKGLPQGSPAATAAVAGGSAVLSGALAALAE